MADVVVVLHSRVARGEPIVHDAVALLENAGKSVAICRRTAPPDPGRRLSTPEPDEACNVAGAQLVVTFGGDGTFLYAARAAVPEGIALLGVNLGRLGFMAWVDLAQTLTALEAWTGGRTQIEDRAVMHVQVQGGEEIAINEAALQKNPDANVIHVETFLDGVRAGSFHSDGAIISTATGSTAYNASAGGPLLDPRLDAMVFLPINAHNLATRALVVRGDSSVELSVDEPSRLILDGTKAIDLPADTRVVCSLGGPPMRLVRVPDLPDFYAQLREKMTWGRPLVREGRR